MQHSRRVTVILFSAFAALASLSAQDDFTAGKTALERKAYTEAISHLQAALKQSSRNVEISYTLGEAYREKGVMDSARSYLERAIDLDDEYTPAYIAIFPVYGRLGAWEQAVKKFNDISKVDKKNPAIPLALGYTYLAADSLDKAVVYFSKAKEIDENGPDTYVGLSEAYGRQNIFVLAISNLQRAIELAPKRPGLHYQLGKAFYRNRQYNDAAKEFAEAINLDPKNANVILELADLYYRAKLYRDAARFYTMYVALVDTNAAAWEAYGQALYWSKYFKDAAPVLEKAIKFNPSVFELKPMYARSLAESQDNERGIAYYKTIPPDSLKFDDYLSMGRAFLRLKDTANCIVSFLKAEKIDTTGSDLASELAWLYVQQRKFDLAAEQYEMRLKADPNSISALFYSGFSYYMNGKIDTAKQQFKKLAALRPDYVQGRMFLANMYLAQDSLEGAATEYKNVIVLNDSLMRADTAKSKDKYVTIFVQGYRSLALIAFKEKEYINSVDFLKKAVSYDVKDKKELEDLHLFYAQMNNLARSVKTLTPDEGNGYRDKAVEEYRYVLKLNPKNATALKELKAIVGD